MAHLAHTESTPRHRAERAADAQFAYGDPGPENRRARAWGDPGGYLVIRFSDVVGKATMPEELFLLDARMRVLREGGEQTLPDIPVWLAGVTSRGLDASN